MREPTKNETKKKAPYWCAYYDRLESVHFANDGNRQSGGRQARRLAAYLRALHDTPAEAHYHHSQWHVDYGPGKYAEWRKKERLRPAASVVAALLHSWGVTGAWVHYEAMGRLTDRAQEYQEQGLVVLECACGGTYMLQPNPEPPHQPECQTCRNRRVAEKARG